MAITVARAVAAIESRGLLLVYPVQNKPDPPSLWSALHPRAEMRWTWDSGADPRVAELWHLRSRVAESRRVVYGKWLGGRAMFASKDVFAAMLGELRRAAGGPLERMLSRDAAFILEVLEGDSPQGTAAVRAAVDLTGRANEPAFVAAMRELWSRLLVVGAGEVSEGGFPSLAFGATSALFEDLWTAERPGDDLLERTLARSPSFRRSFQRLVRAVAPR
jgi:hypothetical protein